MRGSEARKGHGVGSDVTLQVHDVQTVDRAKALGIELHDIAQVMRVGAELSEAVGIRGGMKRHALIPVASIYVE